MLLCIAIGKVCYICSNTVEAANNAMTFVHTVSLPLQDGKTPLGVSPNYWIQHIEWDRELHSKLNAAKTQVRLMSFLVILF